MHNSQEYPKELPQFIVEILLAEMRRSHREEGDTYFDAFRYEMFAKRLVAAGYGRSDAIIWAYEWLGDVIEEARQEMLSVLSFREAEAIRVGQARKDFNEGIVGNVLYQAFLDGIEDPASVSNNQQYMAWHSDRSQAYTNYVKQTKGLGMDTIPFSSFVRNYAELHLSNRVKIKRMKMN